MSEFSTDTIPIDSISVSRKVMNDSRSLIEGAIEQTIEETGVGEIPDNARTLKRIQVEVIDPQDYAEKKLSHPRLSIYSTWNIVGKFIQDKSDSMDKFIGDSLLGEAEYEQISEDEFLVGFMLSEEFIERARMERKEAIDILLDAAELHPADPIRNWRNEENDNLWLPVLQIVSVDPAADKILDDFTETLSEKTTNFPVDFYDLSARTTDAEVDIKLTQ